jgi:hypothetical protein
MTTATQTDLRKVAELLCQVWNELAKKNNWPQRKRPEELLQNVGFLRSVWKELARFEQSTRCDHTLLTWVLSRWNWQRSPAPVNHAAQPKLWENLKSSLDLEAEEAAELITKQQREVASWTEHYFREHLIKGQPPELAAESTRKYARLSGKNTNWAVHETMQFENSLRELVLKHSS